MYTRCPDCATVFRVTADALRVAQGDVRCGVCSNTFNAIENLSEQAFRPDSEDDDDTPSPDDSMTVEELPGTENIELADEPASEPELEPEPEFGPEPEPAPVPVAVPVAAAAPAAADDEDRAMEFHADAVDVEKLFVVEGSKPVNFDPAKVAASLTLGENDLDRTDEYPILVLDEQDVPEETILEAEPERPAPPAPAQVLSSSATSPRILIPDEIRRRLVEEAAARAAFETDFGQDDVPAQPRRWPWAAGVAAALLLFGVQVVHSQREELVRDPGVGPWIARTYAFFGTPLATPTDLAAYELRQWGAANDPMQPDRLTLRASIVNRAPYAQPMPLLRLALLDRFGSTLRVGDVAPTDYLPGPGTPRLLESGQRADAEIRVVDPGKDAVGFEMDICMPMDGSIRCASQIAAAP